jgi:tetratricopeptide (TPR) repeat protein
MTASGRGAGPRCEKHVSMSVQRKTTDLVIAVLVAVFGGSLYFHRTSRLTDKDSIVIADFTNTTGDRVFDGSLRQGLATKLEESTFLSIVSDQEIAQMLPLMGQPADLHLNQDLARRVCGYTGSVAVINGSIASSEDGYVVGLNAANCKTGQTLAQEQVTSEDKEHVLAALGKAATGIRAKLGESHALISQFNTPLVEATTSSLEALRAYSLGTKAFNNADLEAALPFLQRAINLDSNFSMAYAALGTDYYNLQEPRLGAENLNKSYELRDRLSEREKFDISCQYYRFVTGDLNKATKACKLWAQTYLRDSRPRKNLSVLYRQLGQFDKSLAEASEAVQVEPSRGANFVNLFDAYLALNRLDEARATVEQAQVKKLDSAPLHLGLYALAFLQNNADAMAHEVAWGIGKPGMKDEITDFEADSAAYAGRLARANTLTQRVMASPSSAEEKERAARHDTGTALREALFGNAAEARKAATTVLRFSADRDVEAAAAIALALSGDTPGAQRLAGDLAKRFPEDTLVQFNYLPTIRASIFLVQNAASKAIGELQVASPYELGTLPADLSLMPVYVRGQSYLAARDGRAAVAEFQKILDHRGVVLSGAIGALAHLGLGRAYALEGDNARARTAYQDFFTLWKDADPDVPILREAKSESESSNLRSMRF